MSSMSDGCSRYIIHNISELKLNSVQLSFLFFGTNYHLLHLQTIPDRILESNQLSGITLEYRRECGGSDVVQSLCQPDEDGILKDGVKQDTASIRLLNGFSLASEIVDGGGLIASFEKGPLRFTHLLQAKGETQNEEIVRGRTTWKKKPSSMPFSS